MTNTYGLSASRPGVRSVIVQDTDGGDFFIVGVGVETATAFGVPTGIEATVSPGTLDSFAITEPLAMDLIAVGYYPPRGIALFDSVISPPMTIAAISGIEADVQTVTQLATEVDNATGGTFQAAPNYTPQEYTKAFLDLLPTGRAWPKWPASTLYQTIASLIGTYSRDPASTVGDEASAFGSSHRAIDVISDTMPYWQKYSSQAVVELLPEWEETLGLPDPCLGDTPTVDQRVREAVARFVGIGGQSIAYYTAYAATLGFTITINEFAPFRTDVSHTDEDALFNQDIIFYWQISSINNGQWLFRTDVNTADEALGGFGNTVLECELRRIAPAHTILNFIYVDKTSDLLGIECNVLPGTLLGTAGTSPTVSIPGIEADVHPGNWIMGGHALFGSIFANVFTSNLTDQVALTPAGIEGDTAAGTVTPTIT